jgi:hypothetical protein
MFRHRLITTAALTAALSFALPSAASASTLLSGYGGPGQGNQAILGSTLIGGGGQGSGGGGGGSATTGTAAGGETASGAGAGGSAAKGAGPRHGRTAARKAAKPAPGAYTPTSSAAASRDTGASTLGLTGADLLYIVLAFAVLVLTALATARLARRAGGAE